MTGTSPCPASPADKERDGEAVEASGSSRTVENFPTWTENTASTASTGAAIASTFAIMVDTLPPRVVMLTLPSAAVEGTRPRGTPSRQ